MNFLLRLLGIGKKKKQKNTDTSKNSIGFKYEKNDLKNIEVKDAKDVADLLGAREELNLLVETEGKSKTKIIKDHLEKFPKEGIDKFFAKDHYDIVNLATLIQNLRKRGMKIHTKTLTMKVFDRTVNYAQYVLIK